MTCPDPSDPPAAAQPSQSSAPKALKNCVRCRDGIPALRLREVAFCQNCAHRLFAEKARAGFDFARGALVSDEGETDADVTEEKVLAIAFSGGLASRSLLHAARRFFRPTPFGGSAAAGSSKATSSPAFGRDRPKEVARIDVLYVDDSAVVPGAKDRTAEARAIVESEGPDFHFVALKLEDVFSVLPLDGVGDGQRTDSLEHEIGEGVKCSFEIGPEHLLSSSMHSVESRTNALQALFSTIYPASTPRGSASAARTRSEDLHRALVQLLLRRTAKQRGAASLILGDSSTRMAIRLIETVSKGAGHKLPIEGAGAIWVEDLLILRPLKEHVSKEVAFYVRTLGLEHLAPQELVASALLGNGHTEGAGEKASIGRLTEAFILSLEKSVASTVSTVSKTGNKLVFLPEDSAAPSPTTKSLAPALEAKRFDAYGPSVPLPRRGGRRSSITSIASAITTSTNRGAKTQRLQKAVLALERWDGRNACPLCAMPAHSGAKDWKANLTISALTISDDGKRGGDRTSTSASLVPPSTENSTMINLSALLCYACILILEPAAVGPARPAHWIRGSKPETASRSELESSSSPSMTLPPHVLHLARKRLLDRSRSSSLLPSDADGNGDGLIDGADADADAEDDLYAAADGGRRRAAADATACDGQGKNKPKRVEPRKIGREEMRDRIDGFLLEDEREG